MRAIKKILVGVELGDEGGSALQEATLIARTFGAQLHLLHVVPGRHAAADAHSRQVVVEAQQLMGSLASSLEAKGHEVARPAMVLEGGNPASSIVAAAGELGCDLIVLGAGSRGTLDRVILGGTAEQVVRESPRPVWLVRPGKDHAAIGSVLCAVDASDPARDALALGVFLARTFVARLHTVSVVAEAGSSASDAGAVLREALGKIDLHGVDQQQHVRRGKPAVQLVEAAAELGVDLLILGSARRRGLARVLRTNTAEKVIRQVPCSILVVPVERDAAIVGAHD